MEISVWDTYVKREDGKIMHFDILVPEDVKDQQAIFAYGLHYLKSKPFQTSTLTANACRFCHIEKATKEMIASIAQHRYAIIEIENCN